MKGVMCEGRSALGDKKGREQVRLGSNHIERDVKKGIKIRARALGR